MFINIHTQFFVCLFCKEIFLGLLCVCVCTNNNYIYDYMCLTRNNFKKVWIIVGTIWMYLWFSMYIDLLHGKPSKKNKLCRCKCRQQSWKSRQYKKSNFWPLTKRSKITSCKALYASVREESKFGWKPDLQRIAQSTSLSQEQQ